MTLIFIQERENLQSWKIIIHIVSFVNKTICNYMKYVLGYPLFAINQFITPRRMYMYSTRSNSKRKKAENTVKKITWEKWQQLDHFPLSMPSPAVPYSKLLPCGTPHLNYDNYFSQYYISIQNRSDSSAYPPCPVNYIINFGHNEF